MSQHLKIDTLLGLPAGSAARARLLSRGPRVEALAKRLAGIRASVREDAHVERIMGLPPGSLIRKQQAQLETDVAALSAEMSRSPAEQERLDLANQVERQFGLPPGSLTASPR